MGAFVLGMKLYICVCVCVCTNHCQKPTWYILCYSFLIKAFGLFVNKGQTTFDILHLQRQIFNFF
jgi:hypothetical protein